MALLNNEEVDDTLSMMISDNIRMSIKFSCDLCGTDIDVLDTRFATMTANKVWNKIIPECPICGKKMIINSWGAF
nr:MAG TPA: zinc-ribbon domain protein [Caudoviricetes sp.]